VTLSVIMVYIAVTGRAQLYYESLKLRRTIVSYPRLQDESPSQFQSQLPHYQDGTQPFANTR
jgi:hypothetical protein